MERTDAGEPAPSLAALRAAVYGPGAGDVEVAALERALALLPTTAAAGVPGAPPEPIPDEPEPRPVAASARRRRWVRPAACGAALVAGAAAGALLVTHSGAAPARPEVSTVVHLTVPASTAVFDRPQRASDRPGVALDPTLEPASVRSLLTAGRFTVYGARDRSGRICLLALLDGVSTTCAAPERFRRDGLLLLSSTDLLTVDPAGLRQMRSRLTLAASWAPSGAVTLGAVQP